MNLGQLLLKFDKSKEKIPRQITSIVSMRDVWGSTQKNEIAEQVKAGSKKAWISPQTKFDLDGISGVIEKQENVLKVAAIIAGYRYTVNNHYLSDIGAGLYTMLTNKQGLYDYRELGSRDPKTGKWEITGARIICSLSTLYKAAFGPLVNHNGNAIDGAGEIIREAKKKIMPIVNGEISMPRAYASIKNKKKQKDGKTKEINAVIEGCPLHIYRKVSGAKDVLVIDLDYFFFPCRVDNEAWKVKKDNPYIHRVAGQTAFMQLGSMLENKGGKQSPIKIDTAIKIITAAQAAFEMQYFAPGIVKETGAGRINISLRRKAIKNLYPSAVQTTKENKEYIQYSDIFRGILPPYLLRALKSMICRFCP